MALLGSDSNVDIRISTSADTKGVDQTTKALGNLDKQGSSTSGILSALGASAKIAATAVAAATTAIGAGAFAAIKSAGSYEQSRIAFDTMLGSADKARELMSQIADFAKVTPFELPEVVAGTKQLLAYGFAQEDVLRQMKMVGDVASGVGVPVQQIALAYGQVRVKGRLMGQEMLQFTNAGVDLAQSLSEVMGVAKSDIADLQEQGKISFSDVEEAMIRMTSEGGRFFGMMDNQSRTFNGVVSNIKDGFGQMLRAAVGVTAGGDVLEGGLFDRIKDGAEKVMPLVQSLSQKIGPFMQSTLESFDRGAIAVGAFFSAFSGEGVTSNGFIGKMEEFGVQARRIWDTVYNILKPAIDELWITLRDDLFPTLQEFWKNHGEEVKEGMILLAKVVGGILVGALWLFINAVQIVVETVSAWIAIFDKVMSAITWFRDGIINTISRIVNQFMAGRNYIVSIFDGLIGFFASIPGRIGSVLGGVFNTIIAPFSRAFDWISGLGGRIVGSVGNIGNLLRNTIGNWDIPGPLGLVRDVIPGFAKGVRNFGGGLAVVGEEGPELVNLPRGADVFTNRESAGMMSSTTNNRSVSIQNLSLNGADGVREFFSQIDSDLSLTMMGFAPSRSV